MAIHSVLPQERGLWRKRNSWIKSKIRLFGLLRLVGCLPSLRVMPWEWNHVSSHNPFKEHPVQTLTVRFFISSVSRVCTDLAEILWLTVNYVLSKKPAGNWLKCCYLLTQTKMKPRGLLWPSLLSLIPKLRPKGSLWGEVHTFKVISLASPLYTHPNCLAHLLHQKPIEVIFLNLQVSYPTVMGWIVTPSKFICWCSNSVPESNVTGPL